jgi:copper(I)-binding protein
MRLIEALTLILAIIAMLSPFAALIVPLILQTLSANQQSILSVSDAWIRPINVSTDDGIMEGMVMGEGVTAAYMLIENRGGIGDRLIRITTDAAVTVELHLTQIDDTGFARMRIQPDGIEIPANTIVRIEPLSYHVMLSDLTRSLERGQSVTLQLNFASGTVQDVSALVSDYAPDADTHEDR